VIVGGSWKRNENRGACRRRQLRERCCSDRQTTRSAAFISRSIANRNGSPGLRARPAGNHPGHSPDRVLLSGA
jgi:hypothetical protein